MILIVTNGVRDLLQEDNDLSDNEIDDNEKKLEDSLLKKIKKN